MQAAKLLKRDAEDCSKVFTRPAAWLACIRCHNMRVLSRSKCSTIETGTADRRRRPKVPRGELAMYLGHASPSHHRLSLSTKVHAGSSVFLGTYKVLSTSRLQVHPAIFVFLSCSIHVVHFFAKCVGECTQRLILCRPYCVKSSGLHWRICAI